MNHISLRNKLKYSVNLLTSVTYFVSTSGATNVNVRKILFACCPPIAYTQARTHARTHSVILFDGSLCNLLLNHVLHIHVLGLLPLYVIVY